MSKLLAKKVTKVTKKVAKKATKKAAKLKKAGEEVSTVSDVDWAGGTTPTVSISSAKKDVDSHDKQMYRVVNRAIRKKEGLYEVIKREQMRVAPLAIEALINLYRTKRDSFTREEVIDICEKYLVGVWDIKLRKI